MDEVWLKEKVETIEVHLSEIKVTLALNTQSLVEHERRSLANEKAVELLKSEIRPISTHVAVVGAMIKTIGILGTIVGLVLGIMKLVGH